jgi:hypothetical protein
LGEGAPNGEQEKPDVHSDIPEPSPQHTRPGLLKGFNKTRSSLPKIGIFH